MARKGENIYKRKDGRWEGRYKIGFNNNGKSKYRSVYGKTYSEVKNVLACKKIESRKGLSACVSTIRELSLLWLNESKRKNKESTVSVYITKIYKYILPKLGGVKFEILSVEIINNFINELISLNLSQKYITDIAGVLKSILRFAAQIYGCTDKSCLITTSHKYSNNEKAILSPTEEHNLFTFLCNKPTSSNLAILLAMTTGMKIGEICALKWSDIDLDKKIITVNHTVQRIRTFNNECKTKVIETTPKSFKSKREIPIPNIIYQNLKAIESEPENYLISSTKVITEPRTMQYRFKSILKKENLSQVTFHSLRHLFATKCIAIGVDVKTLSELLGHCSVEITLNRYVHSSNKRKFECMQLYSDNFFHL